MISSRGRKIFVAIAGAAVTLVALLCIFPFWMVVIGSLTPENEIYVRGYSLWP